MDNYAIAENFSLLSKLMDIHGENSFKSKTYSSAAFAIEKLPQELASLSKEKIFHLVRPPTARGSGQSCLVLIPAPRMPPTQRDGSMRMTLAPSCFAAMAALIPEGVAP